MRSIDKRYVFIAGLHRSGTSLLHRAIQRHPSITGFENTGVPENEGQHLQSVFLPAAAIGGPGRFCFSADSHLDESSPLLTQDNRQKLTCEWERHWDESKPIRIEKSPPNLVRMRFLQAMFPQSQFLIVVRHPLASGYAVQKWSNTGIRELIQHWNVAHQKMLNDLPHIARWRILRYEDFIDRPRRVLKAVQRWLGVGRFSLSEKVESKINQKYFAHWEADMAQGEVDSYTLGKLSALPQQFGYHFRAPYTRPISFMPEPDPEQTPTWQMELA